MQFNTIISTEDLAAYYDPVNWIIIDSRFDLSNPGWGNENFLQNHIPGSIFADLNLDLSAPVTGSTGRHPLPDAEIFSLKLSQWGIYPEIQVVVVDTANGTFAARLWWMLKAIGHNPVAVLDGGFLKWLKEGRQITREVINPQPTSYRNPATFSFRPQVSSDVMRKITLSKGYCILDARAPERYRGEVEPIDSVAGRIPGAVNRPTSENLRADGTLKSPSELRNEYHTIMKSAAPEQTIVYCGSGVTSCHLILAMEVAGLRGAALYSGSWSEWIRNPENPVQRG